MSVTLSTPSQNSSIETHAAANFTLGYRGAYQAELDMQLQANLCLMHAGEGNCKPAPRRSDMSMDGSIKFKVVLQLRLNPGT